MLQPLLSLTPEHCVYEGVPVLQPGCRWPTLADGTQVGLFVMGAMAQLVLGPNAGNLFGARVGAAQISAGLRDAGLFRHMHSHGADDSGEAASLAAYVSAGGNPFACLGDSECSGSDSESESA